MIFFLVAAAALTHYLTSAGEREQVPARNSLADFPAQLGAWRQIDAQSLGAGQVRELKADDYLSRTYANQRGDSVYLFVAYYASQRHRQTFHSPQNCIPGSGWSMSDHRLHSFGEEQTGEERQINEYLIEKDGAQMLAFYWYQGRGRIVASDYWGRIYTIKDAMILGRTDGALVRIIVPIGRGDDAETQARTTGLEFSRDLIAVLSNYVPG